MSAPLIFKNSTGGDDGVFAHTIITLRTGFDLADDFDVVAFLTQRVNETKG
jgi:hypothetical protein